MAYFYIDPKLQNRIKEEHRRAEILASIPGGGGMVCKAIIKAGTIEAYAAVNA
jgi:hypothetical protein